MTDRRDVLTGKPHPSNGRGQIAARPCPDCGHSHNAGRSRICNWCECVNESMNWKNEQRRVGA